MTRKFYAELDLVDNNKIINVGNPTDPQDVATKDYVDTRVGTGQRDFSVIATGSGVAAIVHVRDAGGHAHTVRAAAGVPSGAPVGTELPLAADTTASTGGLYFWTGSAWTKIATIP